ncbi:23S rRNA (uracil(1939)-C(5))-methyltransferase RlmD [Aquabacterium fontiphilum]|jgi:23S rRNA (uracil1939-C5)-methyltransferase|uniref:23S rRNA (uracil(1939)-C(5))-methyltransferase RlmD n=1 Tax=Aquabacterium fontiphilum TaxID=450365 RepID=UPI001378CB41|nr:23S rRNA (uracil(1939)-C(5))-methyltransferase RlmD [Aquabacterium fontiphilum]NBD21396.1 23S rRNA (uracil(1939)-C(5))-methyltransferase RlmD [Aquabacterium fontiphilum]
MSASSPVSVSDAAAPTHQAHAEPVPPHLEWLTVESLDLEAQGVAHRADGKVVFIEDALPGEQVRVQVTRRKNNWEQATLTEMRRESAQRVTPGCTYFGLCGGCKMQHFHPAAQVAVKQRVLEDNLWHLGKVKPEMLLRPIEGPTWGYRYRARLSVRYVAKKGTVLVGFHERKSRYVADMQTCEILPAHVSRLLMPLRALIGSMDQRERIPQIEVAVGTQVTVLVLRHLEPLSAADTARLHAFATQHSPAEGGQQRISWWLQPKGPDTVHALDPSAPGLDYTLPEFGITMPFKPTDFTQVNHAINQVLVGRALRLLEARAHERVIDWFCGLGNFTLPLATQAREVLGIEGSETLVARSRENAKANGVAEKTAFVARNLFEITPEELVSYGAADKWLVDPPREGAFALAKAVADLHQAPERMPPGWQLPARIVYVSCNPATLARDAGLLVHQGGYRCTAAGVVNMFPHTAHVESMAVFERDAPQSC